MDLIKGVHRKHVQGVDPKIFGTPRQTEFIVDWATGMLIRKMQEKYNVAESTISRTASKLGLQLRRRLGPQYNRPKRIIPEADHSVVSWSRFPA